MNKVYFTKALSAVCLFFAFNVPNNLHAQYEQKLTLQGSGVFLIPKFIVSGEESTSPETEEFAAGFGLDGGVQYNLNRFFSVLGNARYYLANAKDNDGGYDNVAFGGGFKVNLAGRKKINPYILAEANLNIVWFDYYYNLPESNGLSTYYEDSYLTFGGLAGVGFDFRFNDHFGMFVQSSVYYTHYDSFLNWYNQLGVRISLLKARTI